MAWKPGRNLNCVSSAAKSCLQEIYGIKQGLLFANLFTYYNADLRKFTCFYPLFEMALFGKMRKSFVHSIISSKHNLR